LVRVVIKARNGGNGEEQILHEEPHVAEVIYRQFLTQPGLKACNMLNSPAVVELTFEDPLPPETIKRLLKPL